MSGILDWLKEFWSGRGSPAPALAETSYTESQDRVTRTLPQTHDLVPLLTLIQPANPERPTGRLDHGPDPIAECTMTCRADRPFRCDDIRAIFTREKREEVGLPTLYVVAADGFTTYLNLNDEPAEGVAIRASWSMYEGAGNTEETVAAAANTVAGWLTARPEGFHLSEPLDLEAVEKQFSRARAILAVKPEYVAIIASGRSDEEWFDGVTTWETLHAMDLKWGDMDCFHWLDETHDPRFTVEVDDERFGYALPEEIAAGRQHFRALRFIFPPARTVAPFHVFEQMMRAAQCFQGQSGCQLSYDIDGEAVDGPQTIKQAIAEMVEDLRSIGTSPGTSAVCQLR
jgi:hypothetical protein